MNYTEKLLKDDPEEKNKEDTKRKLKGDLKEKIVEDIKKMPEEDPKEVSSFVKRKPPKELMKGGLRDRSLFSWLRILGWILLLRFSLLIATFTFNLCSYSVVTALWWAFIFGFLTSCFVLMWVSFIPLEPHHLPLPSKKCFDISGMQSSMALKRTTGCPTL